MRKLVFLVSGYTFMSFGRIFDRLKILTGQFVHTGPFDIFALFTRNVLRTAWRLNFGTVTVVYYTDRFSSKKWGD